MFLGTQFIIQSRPINRYKKRSKNRNDLNFVCLNHLFFWKDIKKSPKKRNDLKFHNDL